MDYLLNLVKCIRYEQILFALTLLIFGYFFAKKLSQFLERAVEKRFSKHQGMLLGRVVFYSLFLLFLISALQEMGFNLTVLLGTAGLFTVALSFASQTAASNLISGIFLLFERPFKIGDTIAFKEYRGVVEHIDWLSTKIKTSDNRLIRIPNEALIKTEITNLSTYSSKRDEIILKLSSEHDVDLVKTLLQEVCNHNSVIFVKPGVKILLSQLMENFMELKLSYWAKGDLQETRDQLLTAIKTVFEAEEIAFYKDTKI